MNHRKTRRRLRPRQGEVAGTVAPDLLTGLIAYYRLNSAATDSSGNANNGFPLSAVYSSGKLGNALSGGQVLASLSELAGLVPDTDSFSVVAWMKMASGNSYISLQNEATEFGPLLSMDNEVAPYASWGEGATLTDPTTPPQDGEWVHLAFVFDAGAVKLYSNGALVDSSSTGGTGSDSPLNGSVQLFANGPVIDEVAFYLLALNDAQVAALYNGGIGFDPTA